MINSGNPPRKVDKLRALMAAGKWRQALSLAASWPELGEHRDLIKQAASAALSPRFYSSMGKDPDALIAAGVEALKERYGDPAAPAAQDKAKA